MSFKSVFKKQSNELLNPPKAEKALDVTKIWRAGDGSYKELKFSIPQGTEGISFDLIENAKSAEKIIENYKKHGAHFIWVESYNKNEELSGETIDYYETGKVKSVSNYANDVLSGEQINYSADGKLEKVRNYKNGILDGKQVDYHADGSPELIRNYNSGVWDGKLQAFHKNGHEIFANSGGDNEQILTRYHWIVKCEEFDNKPKSVGEPKNGTVIEYADDGALIEALSFYNDALHGECVTFQPNGQPGMVRTYDLGRWRGDCKMYDQDGDIVGEINADGTTNVMASINKVAFVKDLTEFCEQEERDHSLIKPDVEDNLEHAGMG